MFSKPKYNIYLCHEYVRCFYTKNFYNLTNSPFIWDKKKFEYFRYYLGEDYPNCCHWQDMRTGFIYTEPTELWYLRVENITINSLMPIMGFLDNAFNILDSRQIKVSNTFWQNLKLHVEKVGLNEIAIFSCLIENY